MIRVFEADTFPGRGEAVETAMTRVISERFIDADGQVDSRVIVLCSRLRLALVRKFRRRAIVHDVCWFDGRWFDGGNQIRVRVAVVVSGM
jgi:hypothetical protein